MSDGKKFTLVMTCGACPEQYNCYLDGKQVAYFRLRHGCFTVDDESGECIYSACPNGDGQFEADERERYLNEACLAVRKWLEGQRYQPTELLYEFADEPPA